MSERRKGGERRNGRNTRVWHKKNLDTGMRKAERERERKNKCRIAERSLVHLRRKTQTDRGKVYKAIHTLNMVYNGRREMSLVPACH